MKLHLPKLLRNSVLACITAVAGIVTTTVGTATFTGGVVAFALSGQQAQADYVWNGGSGNKTGDDWKNESSWNMTGDSVWNPGNKDSINGPGTTGSNMWYMVVIDGGDEGVVFGSEDSRDIPLEGWAPKFELSNARLYANMTKLQPGSNDAIFSVTNNSLLDFQMGTGSFQGKSILTIGENSGIIFRMKQTSSTAAMNITMESSTGYVKFLADSNINHTGAITLNPVLGELASDWGSMDLGITAQNVTLSNLTVNLGAAFDGWTKVDTQITEANYTGFGNCYSIIKNAEGKYMLTYAVLQEGSSCIWNGGELSWANDTAFSNKTFSAGSVVQFSESDADVVLQENIEAAAVVIDDGVTVSLDGNIHELNITGALRLDGTLVLKSDCLTVGGTAAGDNGKIVLDAGAEKQWQLADLPQTGTNACTAKVTVASGSLYLTSSSQTMGDITVEDGAGLRLGGNATVGKIVLNGDGGWTSDGAVVNAALFRNNGQGDISVAAVELATDSTVAVVGADKSIIIGGELSGGVLTKTGDGLLRLDGAVNNEGIVIDGGTVRWSSSSSDSGTNALNCGSIAVNAGGVFRINHKSASCDSTAIVLNGGQLYSDDSSTDVGTSFKSLEIQADSEIKYNWNGGLNFGALTGDGDISIVGRDDNGGTTFGKVKNYNGTITSELTRPLSVGAVDQAAGKVMTIDTAVTLTDLTKTGEGGLVVSGAATLTGVVGMNYEGTLTLSGGITLGAGSTLCYTKADGNVLSLGELTQNVTVDILALTEAQIASGVNLGIALAADDDAAALKSLLSVAGLSDYTITSKDGLAWLSSTAAISTYWDKNWGAAELAQGPTELAASTVADGDLALNGNESYDLEGYVAINATGGGENTIIYGGANTTGGSDFVAANEDVWIQASAGQFKGLIGGSRAANWMVSGGIGWNLNADTHIMVDGADAVVGHIIGGFLQECNNPRFNGSSYISVMNGEITGNIAGSSATSDGDNYTSYHTGNTNVFIYVPLSDTTTAAHLITANDPTHIVAGGSIALVHNQTTRIALFEMTGNTNVTIDLSGYEGDKNTFAKALYGGNYTNRTNTGCISKIDGNTNLSITAGNDITFSKDVVAGSLIQNGTSEISGTASLNIAGGTYTGNVVGGTVVTNGATATVGATKVNITGGVLSSVVGASRQTSGNVNFTTGRVDISVSGSALIDNIYGGYKIEGDDSATVSASLDEVNITIAGGGSDDRKMNVYGGSHTVRNNGSSTINQGDITIELKGGTINDVYAAGSQQGSTKIATESTMVKLYADAVIHGVVSGGYMFAADKTGSTVTGTRTLEFAGVSQNRSGVTFKDFDTIKVTEAASVATIGSLTTSSAVTKTGAGTLTLAGDTYALSGGLTVSEGGLATSGATTLGGALTLADGTALNVKDGVLTIDGALTLGTGLVLTTSELVSGDNILISGITSSDITGSVTADTIFASINDLTNIGEHTVKVQDGNLVLTTILTRNLTWDAANSTWKVGSKFGSADTDTFANGDTAIFGALTEATEEVTIDGAVEAESVSIAAGADKTYSFISANGGQLTTSTLEIGAGTAVFGDGTLNIGALSAVTVDGVLDVVALSAGKDTSSLMKKLAAATGSGTVKIGGGWAIIDDADTIQFSVDIEADDAIEILRNNGSMEWNVANSITVTDGTGDKNGDVLVGRHVNLNVQDGGVIDAEGAIKLGNSDVGTGSVGSNLTMVDGGSIKAASIALGSNYWGNNFASSFTMEGGTLELTGTEGIASVITTEIKGGTLKSGDNSWGITGAEIGGVTIETGEGTITLTGGTLTGTIDNSTGKLAMGGAINIMSEGYETITTPTRYSGGGNGYAVMDTSYVVANTVANLTVADGTTWTVDGTTAGNYANGAVTVAGSDWGTEYYIISGAETYSDISKTNDEGEALTAVVLDGNELNLDEALGAVLIKAAKEGQSVVTIGSGVTLASASTVTDASHQIKLGGGGTYALADGVATLGDGVVLGDWNGTVKVTNATGLTNFNVDTLAAFNADGTAKSTVELTGVSGYLTVPNVTYNANLKLTNDGETKALTLTNGWKANTTTFAGAVSGSGSFVIATATPSGASFQFTGDLSQWEGAFEQSSTGTTNLTIASTGTVGADLIRNDGTLKVTFTGADVVMNGDIGGEPATNTAMTNVTIAGGSSVVLNGSVLAQGLTNNGTLSVGGNVSVATLTNAGTLNLTQDTTLAALANTGSVVATGKNITLTGAASGTGSISAGALTLQAASNVVGDLTLTGALTLGADVTSLTAGTLKVAGGLTLNNVVANLISASTVEGGLTLNIAEALLDTTVAVMQDKKVALLTLTGEFADDAALKAVQDSVLLGAFTADGTAGSTQTGVLYDYKLEWDGTTLNLVAAISSAGYVWEGDVDYAWETAGNWGVAAVPNDESAVFLTGGERTNVLISSEAEAGSITVEDWTESRQDLNLGGNGSLAVTKDITINNGNLHVMVDTTVGGNIAVNGSSVFAVESFDGSAKTVEVAGDLTNNSEVQVMEGGTLDITGNVVNNGTIVNLGGTLSAGSMTNSDTLAVVGGSVTVDGALTNSGTVESLDGTLTVGSLANKGEGTLSVEGATVIVNGDVDNDGSIVVTGGEATVNGNLDNTGGDITIGSENSTGSLTVTGNLTGIDSEDKLTVEQGSSLAVGGNLTADQVDLEFSGTVTVGGNATVDELTIKEGASFTANNATIGTLDNDGSLSVGKDVDGTLTGGNLSITTLTGSGDVNVGTDGTLSIMNDADFTGKINSEGAIVVSGEATLYTKTDNGGDITTTQLTVTEAANGSTMGTLTTGGIVIESMTTEAPSLNLESLESNAAGSAVAVTLTQMNSTTGVDGIISAVDAAVAADEGGLSYHLLSITNGTGAALELVEDEASHQYLLKKGYNHSDLMSTASFALGAGSTDAYISFWQQSEDEATWDMSGDTTIAGLVVRDASGMLSEDILDNVQKVVMTGEQTIDLTGDDLTRLTLNKLTNKDGETDSKLTLDGDAGDTVTINNAAYAGTVVLDTLSAVISGTVDTIEAGEGTGISATVEDTTINVNGSDVLLSGSMENGAINIAEEAGVAADSDLDITGTDLNIAYDDKGATTMDTAEVSETNHVLADLGNMTGTAGDVVIGKDGKNSALLEKYFTNIRFDEEEGAVVADRNTSYFSDNFTAESANGEAGMTLADAALLKLNPQLDKDSELGAMLTAIENAGSTTARDELAASLAGASSAVLGMAVSGDVDRQLRAIRNRTTTMGVDQSVANEDMPYFNAWINAEGSMNELSDNGTEGGYKLNSWGGTVGFDVDVCPTFTAGMAFTAMYGDLDVTGVDKATGDLDTYYLSAFARYSESAWTHTFVATVGTGDISLKRTVLGSEQKVETDALSFGLMYEVGRVFALDEDGSACLQPVFNVTWKHTTVDGYTEDGSDLALKVDEQTVDTVTFGLGARLQAVVGESMYNRTSLFEARVLAKADVGDRNGSADVALASLPGSKAEVESAEMGAFGLEAGAGLTIPVGEEGGSIFMDASVELRSDYTDVNGTVGYRINF